MHELRLKGGGRLAYREVGRGRPLIFLHGWAMGGAAFEPQIDGLARRFRLIVPDLRGHGASSPLGDGEGVEALADDIAQLMAQRDLKDALCCGWSMGAMVAWALLQRHGEARFAGLVVIDMTPRIANEAGWDLGMIGGHDREAARRATLNMRRGWRTYCPIFVPRIFAAAGKPDADLVARVTQLAQGNDVASMAGLWQSMVAQDFRAFLAKLSLPTLIVHGARSQLYDAATARWLAARLPHASLACFSRSGHAPHLEEPHRFNRVVGAFADALAHPSRAPGAAPSSAFEPLHRAKRNELGG
ncbi:MAG: alpha/beta fold hydrolase [Pseudomonadota bacterium]